MNKIEKLNSTLLKIEQTPSIKYRKIIQNNRVPFIDNLINELNIKFYKP